MCGGGGFIILYKVSVVRHKVPPEFVKVLHRDGQEKLDPTEDVQQCLQDKYKRLAEETPSSVTPPEYMWAEGSYFKNRIRCMAFT